MKNRKSTVVLALILALALTYAVAAGSNKVMNLPRDLEVVEASAFEGDKSLDRVVLPDGVQEIQTKAFAKSSLREINLPGSLTSIAADAFDGPKKVRVKVQKWTFAYDWAIDNGYIAAFPESDHPYEPDSSITYTYKHPFKAEALGVVFSSETSFENGGDSLTVIDSTGEKTAYTGRRLAGLTLALPGDQFELLLQSDSFAEDEGFSVIDIYPMTKSEYDAFVEHERKYPFYTETLSNGTIGITGYKGSADRVAIPSKIDGVKVTAIGEGAFRNRSELKEVAIPKTVSSIANNAFANCFNLRIKAAANSYAERWAAAHGFADSGDKFVVMPDTNDGSVTTKNGVNIWTDLGGTGDSVRFAVKAPDKWSVKSDGAWLDGKTVSESFDANETRYEIYYDRNATGAARTATLVFTCGSTVEKYQITQLPRLETELKTKPNRMIYKAGADLTLEWTVPRGAESFEFYYCTHSYLIHSEYPVKISGGKATVTIPSEDLEPGQEGHVMYMYAIDKAGHAYKSESYTFYVHDGDNLNWGYSISRENRETYATINQYYGAASTLKIPAQLGGYPVRIIQENTFYANKELKTVVVPEGVTRIGNNAFESCTALEKITLPSSLKRLDDGAFKNCVKLATVSLPKGLAEINGETFENCKSLTDVAIPNTVKEIGYSAFQNCKALKAVYIPKDATIGGSAFSGCDGLTLYGEAGSNAEQYAQENNIPFKTGSIPK